MTRIIRSTSVYSTLTEDRISARPLSSTNWVATATGSQSSWKLRFTHFEKMIAKTMMIGMPATYSAKRATTRLIGKIARGALIVVISVACEVSARVDSLIAACVHIQAKM